jgi:ketosteroid isomerase-like protein
MATATHLTEGTVKTADGKTIDQRVRETSVFRKEDGGWKMIGHQADNYPVWIDVVDR